MLLLDLQVGNKKIAINLIAIALMAVLSNDNLKCQKNAKLSSTHEITLIKGLSSYRDKLILKDLTNLKSFINTFQKWKSLQKNEEEFDLVVNNLHHLIYNSTIDSENIVDTYKKSNPTSKLVQSINEEEVFIFFENYNLYQLIEYEIVDSKYPFVLRASDIIDEIKFYELSPNDKIAEIGAGNGFYSFLIGMLNMNLSIYTNELDENKLLSAAALIDSTLESKNKYHFILGDKKNINLNDSMDIIFTRNSLHHFSHKDEMLKSINNNLKKDGIFIVEEIEYSNKNKEAVCPNLMKEKDILKTLNKNGFKLIAKKSIGESILYKFQKTHQ